MPFLPFRSIGKPRYDPVRLVEHVEFALIGWPRLLHRAAFALEDRRIAIGQAELFPFNGVRCVPHG